MKNIYAAFIALTLLSFTPLSSASAYDLPYVGDMVEYEAAYEDTFVHLARDHNMGFTELRAANPTIDPWLPGAGTKIILPSRQLLPDATRNGIVINLPEMRLYAYLKKDEPPITFPLGVGREGLETPTGSTSIVRKKSGPTWRPTKRMRDADPELKASYPPGPDNPLGSHALYFGWPTYAIHGTNRPFGIGRRISSGCIRMYPEDIKELFKIIPVGTNVTVVDQPVKAAWIDDTLYLEATVTMDKAIEMEETARITDSPISDKDLSYIARIAGDQKDAVDWDLVKSELAKRHGYPIAIATHGKMLVSDNDSTTSERPTPSEDTKPFEEKQLYASDGTALEETNTASGDETTSVNNTQQEELIPANSYQYMVLNP